MARRISVEIVGDASQLERTFGKASASASVFQHDINKASRGALAGSGAFHSLGRSIAFASGGFLAFASASQAIRSSLDAAETSEKALRSLGAQARASGINVGDVFEKIGKLASPALKLGFNKADLEQGLTTLIRGTGSTKKALSEMAAAEDVARVKGVSLAQGALIVNRALISSGNSARALGIHFPKAATAAEKLQIILAKFAGQAQALTTPTDRFNAALFNTEQIVGSALLPVLNKYLAELTGWLTKMDQSGKLQRDVASAAKDVASAFTTAVSVVKAVDKVTGSLANTLKDLAAVFLILKARTALIRWGVIQSGIANIGTSAATAEVKVGLLSRSLLALRGLGPIAIAIGVTEFVSFLRAQSKGIKSQQGPNFMLNNGQTFALGAGRAFGVSSPPPPQLPAPYQFPTFDPAKAAAAQKAMARQKAGEPVSLLGQFNIDELKLANAAIAGSTGLQKSILQNEEAIVLKLRDQAKTLKDRTKYAQQAASIEDSIRAIDQQGVTATNKAAAAARKSAAAAAKAALGGIPLSLQLAQAKADAIAAGMGAQDMTKAQINAARSIRNYEYKAMKSHMLSMQGIINAWQEIYSINQQLGGVGKGLVGTYHAVSTVAVTSGLNLTHDQRVALEERLAQRAAHRGFKPSSAAALGYPVGSIVLNNPQFYGVRDINALWSELQKVAKTKPRAGIR